MEGPISKFLERGFFGHAHVLPGSPREQWIGRHDLSEANASGSAWAEIFVSASISLFETCLNRGFAVASFSVVDREI